MNVLFLTLVQFDSIREHNLYTDLLRVFVRNGHRVYAFSPVERKQSQQTHLNQEENAVILRLQIGNTQKTSIIEKGISTVMIEPTFKKAIRKYFSDVKFDLVLYSTPPITLVSAIEYVKKRDKAKTYLLLKDIFPQNAVDIGMMTMTGFKGVLYQHFRRQEKKLYRISDHIGCMSPANIRYLLKHNSEIAPERVEVCPNSIEVIDKSVESTARKRLRGKYHIPLDKTVFVYGGNFGRPQGIPFMIECLKACKDLEKAFFLIVGDGTEYHLLQEYVEIEKQKNVRLMSRLPKDDYDTMVAACDVGMIFLDHRFTIPNFPSRLLAYMQAKLPVLACTDPNTDLGKIITEGQFGWWCESDDSSVAAALIGEIIETDLQKAGERGFMFLSERYCVKKAYEVIESTYEKRAK